MDRRKLEKLDIDVSLLGFGCMRFPLNEDGSIDEVESQRLLDYGMENGITYIDTAYIYHKQTSEDFLGKALAKYNRADYTLATKLPIIICESREHAKELFELQLKKLNTDYVDFYLLHALDMEKWKKVIDFDLIGLLEEFRDEGKIKYIGFSFHDEYDAFDMMIRHYKWDFCQLQLNYMDLEEQAGIKGHDLVEELGIPVIVMEPVRGGALVNFSDDINEKFNNLDKDKSIASFGFRFVADMSNVKCILSGMSTFEQVVDNVSTFTNNKILSNEERKVIYEVRDILNDRMKNLCTGCNYCMPCPHGVNIPENFKIWNSEAIYRNYNTIKFKHKSLIKNNEYGDKCVGCGVCVLQCPQQINIPEDLGKVIADLDNNLKNTK